MIQPKQNNQSGFTLLELVVVIAVLGLIANMATEFVAQNTNQQRFDTTKDRMEKIRYAIIGDITKTTNGQPDLTGFVHDMGRLPITLSELHINPLDCDPDAVGDQTCTANYDSTINRNIGWRGPYVSKEIASTDGWGQSWSYSISDGKITLKSLGLDNTDGELGINPYEKDQPIFIVGSDYQGEKETSFNVKFTDGIGVCTNDEYKTQNSCEEAAFCSDFTDKDETTCTSAGETWATGVWVVKPATFSCSDSAHNIKTDCDAAGATWARLPQYTCTDNTSPDKTSCNIAGATWEVVDNEVCAQLSFISNGSLTSPLSTTGPSTYSVGSTAPFAFSDRLPIGQVLLSLYEYESGTCQTAAIASVLTTIYPRRTTEILTM